MSTHPYPRHIIRAVTLAAEDHWEIPWPDSWSCACGEFETPGTDGQAQRKVLDHITESMLAALWEASRVDTMAQVDALPPGTLLHTSTGTFMASGVMADRYRGTHLPAQVIHWGDRV